MPFRLMVIAVALSLCGLAWPAHAQAPQVPSEEAPPNYKARFDTSKGTFVVEVRRDAAPNGADRFYNLVKSGFFDNARFFRVVSGFVVQFGINGDPAIMAKWREARIKDDPVKVSNQRSFMTFATSGPDSRTTQVFISLVNNDWLDSRGFAPFGKVVSGMDVIDKLYGEYGESPPKGNGPEQSRIQMEGNAYLNKSFPKLDYIKKATVEK
jgi:peptidyl-prolyl cis-trans isomerase A (cyclophilin A)